MSGIPRHVPCEEDGGGWLALHPYPPWLHSSYNFLIPAATGVALVLLAENILSRSTRRNKMTTGLPPKMGSSRTILRPGTDKWKEKSPRATDLPNARNQLRILPDSRLVSTQLLKPPVQLLDLV